MLQLPPVSPTPDVFPAFKFIKPMRVCGFMINSQSCHVYGDYTITIEDLRSRRQFMIRFDAELKNIVIAQSSYIRMTFY